MIGELMMVTNVREGRFLNFESGLPLEAQILMCSEMPLYCMKMANRFANKQCITALTLVFINKCAILNLKECGLQSGRQIGRQMHRALHRSTNAPNLNMWIGRGE